MTKNLFCYHFGLKLLSSTNLFEFNKNQFQWIYDREVLNHIKLFQRDKFSFIEFFAYINIAVSIVLYSHRNNTMHKK